MAKITFLRIYAVICVFVEMIFIQANSTKDSSPTNEGDDSYKKCDLENHLQSPIDINASISLEDISRTSFKDLTFTNYCEYDENSVTIKVYNDSRSVFFTLTHPANVDVCVVPHMTGGRIQDANVYWMLVRMEFKWPSAHKINGKTSLLEVECLLINPKFLTLENARKNPNGVVIVSIMFPLINSERDIEDDNQELEQFLKYITMVKYPNTNNPMIIKEKLNLMVLIPEENIQTYAFYKGRFSSAPCDPADRYVVLQDIDISDKQLEIIKNTQSEVKSKNPHDEMKIIMNSRQVQTVTGKCVHYIGRIYIEGDKDD